MRKEVGFVVSLKERLGDTGPVGLVLDVEPYLTDTYRKNPKRTMDIYLSAMRRTYDYARERGVELIICIPYFFDSKGFPDHLEALIEEASDGVAVMNYYKEGERKNLETEMGFARRAGKRLINIAELQRPGTHDLTERNTYYHDGLPAVGQSFEALTEYFDYVGLTFALHDYTALRKVLDRE